jgi:hypothetical protein
MTGIGHLTPYRPMTAAELRKERAEMAKSLTPEQEAEARALFAEFFATHPSLRNPTDINHRDKAFFMFVKGWEKFRLMQRARKQGLDFTRPGEDDADDPDAD